MSAEPSGVRQSDVAVVAAVAAIAHFLYFALRFGSFYFPDSFTYLEPARHLLAGDGFVSGPRLAVETIRTPGYPLLLLLSGIHVTAVIAAQHLMSVAIAAAIYVFVVRRIASRVAASASALVFALDVPSIHIANKLLTETAFTAVLFLIFLLALLPRSRPVLLGLLCGSLVLIRPIAIVFFAVAGIRIPRRQWIAFLLAALALPIGWSARNWAHTRVFTVSSIGDINLLTQRAAGALAIEDGGDFAADLMEEQKGLVADADDSLEHRLRIEDAQDLPVAVRAKEYGRYARGVIAQHPAALAELTLRGIAVNLFDGVWRALEPVTLLHPSLLEYSVGFLPAMEFFFAVIGVAALWRRDRVLAVMIVLTVAYFVILSAGGEAEARFRVPVIPEIAIAAGIGVETIRRSLRDSVVRGFQPAFSSGSRPDAG